jgi:hypothetical protein
MHFLNSCSKPPCLQNPLLNPRYKGIGHLVVTWSGAEQKSSLQLLEFSHDEDHSDGNVECRGVGASEGGLRWRQQRTCLKGARASQGATQVPIHSQVASHGTGVVNVHIADMAR